MLPHDGMNAMAPSRFSMRERVYALQRFSEPRLEKYWRHFDGGVRDGSGIAREGRLNIEGLPVGRKHDRLGGSSRAERRVSVSAKA